jgi:hypothetical protein
VNEEKRLRELSSRDYIHRSFDLSDRLAVLARNPRRGEIVERISTAVRIAGPQFQDWLHHKNEIDGCDIYLSVNPLKPEVHTRSKQDIQVIKHLYVDLSREGVKSFAAIQHSRIVPPPSYVLHPSPHMFQAIWRVEEITHEQGEALLHALARHFDSDPDAAHLTRTLRLPGFANKKCKQDFWVTMNDYTGRIYHTRDFKLRTDPVESNLPWWSPSVRHTLASREQTQAERDVAYAKGALARGFSPEDVIRDIAEFRVQENSHAEDYARHTVAAAQAELTAQRSTEGTRPALRDATDRELC